MQVEPEDFILSLDVDSNENTEIVTTEVSELPPDLVNADVSDLADNSSLWLGLEGALESNDSVSNMAQEPAMDDQQVQLHDHPNLGVDELGHSEEVETLSIDTMEVDVQTSEVSRNEEISSMPLDSFMDQTDIGINILNTSNTGKGNSPLIPVTLSLPFEPVRAKLPQFQQRKAVSMPTTSQVTKVVLAPAGQSQSGQPLLFTLPSSASGLTSLLTPNTNLRFVNTLGTSGNKGATVVGSTNNIPSQSVRLMSPTKTITFQQAQQLGLISPKKGQSLIVNKVSMATGSNTSTTPSTLLAGKQGAKYAGGNVTLVRSAVAKTPTKIAPAPPQSVVTAVSTSSQQPTSLLIKNASGQVTMATLVQSKQSGAAGVSSLANLSPQKFVLRPSAPVSVSSAQVRQGSGTQPAQYIRLTTAQALAAGILPGVGSHGENGGQQQLQLAGNKIQLVRVVTSNSGASSNSGTLVSASGSPVVIGGASSATTVKLAVASSSLMQPHVSKALQSSLKTGAPVKSTVTVSTSNLPQGAQRILLPAGSIGSLGTNLVMVPTQYVTQQTSTALVTATAAAAVSTSLSTNTVTVVSSHAMPSPIVSSTPTTVRTTQQKVIPPPSSSPESSQSTAAASQSKTQAVLESNGLKPRKPCNCTKSQCLKLYCDCFANGEFCNGCNCVCCANNLENEEMRLRAIRSCLDRNPHAFKPKIGAGWGPEPRRHNKGCHCKRSGCLKNYCECYEAKIACSAICKCIGCKNCVDPIGSPPGPGEKKNVKMAALLSQQSSATDSRTASNPSIHPKSEDRSGDIQKGFASLSSSGSKYEIEDDDDPLK